MMWRLAQVVPESGWDRYKLSQNHSSPSPEAMGACRVFTNTEIDKRKGKNREEKGSVCSDSI